MSSNKEKDKEKEININRESVPPSMQSTDAPWYDAQPTASEYYRYQNEPFRQISREGEAEIYPDYYEKYDARRGKNIISGPLTREIEPRMQSIDEGLRNINNTMAKTKYKYPVYDFNLPSTIDEKQIFGRMPKVSPKPSETFGSYIMRPPVYEERTRLYNSPRPSIGGGFMPYHGTSAAPRDTITSFADGMKLFVDRMENDARYFRGNVTSKYLGEKDYANNIGAVILRSEEKGKTLYDLSKDEMLDMLDDISQEKESMANGDTNDKKLQGMSPMQYEASLDGQIKVLNSLIKAKDVFTSPERYEDYIRSVYRNGGKGMQIMQEANTKREKMPVAKGWALAGDIASAAVHNILPIAARMISPWASAIALVGNLSLNANSSMAEAAMEIDEYEKATGNKINDLERNSYIYSVGATDLMMDALMQSIFFRNIPRYSVAKFRNTLQGEFKIKKNAVGEMKKLVDQVSSKKFGQLAQTGKQMLMASSMQAASGASQSLTRDLLTTIYRNPEHYPTLTEMLTNAAIGAGIGFGAGGFMDVLSRRPTFLFGQKKHNINGDLVFFEDMPGTTYQYMGTDPKTGLYKGIDLTGKLNWIDPADVVDVRSVKYNDYIALQRRLNERSKALTKNELNKLVLKLKSMGRKPVLKLIDKIMPEKKPVGLSPEEKDKNLLNTHRIYRVSEDSPETDEMLERYMEGKVYYDEPSGLVADREILAPVKEDLNFPTLYYNGSYHPGRQWFQQKAYKDAPFINGDELTWRMFNPEAGDAWLEHNPFFRTGDKDEPHDYAHEIPYLSPYRPYHYRDKNMSEEEYIKRLEEIMGVGIDDIEDPSIYENRRIDTGPSEGVDNRKFYFDNKEDLDELEKIIDSEHSDFDYDGDDGYAIGGLDGYPMFDEDYEPPITSLRVNGKDESPIYRDEYGLLLPIPSRISPKEDLILQTKELANRLRLKTRLYRTMEDVPTKIREKLEIDRSTKTFYNPDTKEIGIIVSKSGVIDMRLALLEYGIINRGLKKIFGEKTDDFLREVYRKIPKKYKKYYYEIYGPFDDGAAAYLVDIATNPNLDDSDWNTFSAMARRFLKEKFGIGEIKDVDLRYILWKAVNKIREDDSISAMQKKNKRLKRFWNKDEQSSSQSGKGGNAGDKNKTRQKGGK